MKNKEFKVGVKHFLFYTTICFAILFVICFSILIVIERRVRITKFEEVKISEQVAVNLGAEILGAEFSDITADLLFISYIFSNYGVTENVLSDAEKSWSEFSRLKRTYDQIRYIDEDGNEVVRVNYIDGDSYIVPEEDLQNKADRYYFTETAALDDCCLYISPLDLNIENGKIEIPYKPMIRFSKPIYVDGEFKGIVIVNYIAEQILDTFRKIASQSARNMALLNDNGYWLSSEDSSQEWTFMFEDRENDTFSSHFPKEWDLAQHKDAQTLTENGLFTYRSVDLTQKVNFGSIIEDVEVHLNGGDWHVVSYVLREEDPDSLYYENLFQLMIEELIENIVMILVLFVISIAFAILLYLYMKSYVKIRYYSRYDSLTNIYNRHYATTKLDEMLALKERKHFKLSLCFVDVNGLKEVNDNLGHKAGDELLKTVATIMKNQVRETDFVARMGGDEFLIAFPRTGAEVAEAVWQRILENLKSINDTEERDYIISVSHGIVMCDVEHACATTDRLIKEADNHMYEEKSILKKNFYAVRSKK